MGHQGLPVTMCSSRLLNLTSSYKISPILSEIWHLPNEETYAKKPIYYFGINFAHTSWWTYHWQWRVICEEFIAAWQVNVQVRWVLSGWALTVNGLYYDVNPHVSSVNTWCWVFVRKNNECLNPKVSMFNPNSDTTEVASRRWPINLYTLKKHISLTLQVTNCLCVVKRNNLWGWQNLLAWLAELTLVAKSSFTYFGSTSSANSAIMN